MTAGTIVLASASIIRGESWNIPSAAETWVAFTYLVVFVTIVAFLLYMFVLSGWTASGTSYGFVVVPLVTIVVAATVADETITPGFLAGAALVLLGIYVGALMPGKEKQAALLECQNRASEVLYRCT